jgi:hypothetical protein
LNSPRRTPLTSGGTIDQHKAVKYVETQATDPAGGQFAATWTSDGRNVTVAGPCPACAGRTATDFSPGIGGVKGYRGFGQPESRRLALPSPVTLFCECGHAHADRPDDAFDRGCGRYWRVHLTEDERRPPAPGPAKP